MSVKREGTKLYPLELNKILNQGEIVYDRDTRNKSYFYLRYKFFNFLRFKTSTSKDFICLDGMSFNVVE